MSVGRIGLDTEHGLPRQPRGPRNVRRSCPLGEQGHHRLNLSCVIGRLAASIPRPTAFIGIGLCVIDPGPLSGLRGFFLGLCRRVSISSQTGPRIGIQLGPLWAKGG